MKIAQAWTSVPESVGMTDQYWLEEENSYHCAAARLVRHGHSLSMCQLSLSARRSVVRDGVQYEFFPCDDASLPVRQQSSRALLAFITDASFDVLVIHLFNRLLTNQLLALDIKETARVLHGNTYCLQGSTFDFLAKHQGSLTGMIANSPTLLAEMTARLGSSEVMSIVLPSAADPRQFRPRSLEKRWDLIWTGQMRKDDAKNLDQLIDVAAKASASLALIGDGNARSELEEYARRRAPEARVEFLGWRRHSQLPHLLNQARLYATTADFDPAPRGVTEALACGLPALGLSTCRGLEEQVHPEQNGFLATDSDELSRRVRRLLSDQKMQETMGRTSRRIALRKFHPDHRNRRLINFFSELVESLPLTAEH